MPYDLPDPQVLDHARDAVACAEARGVHADVPTLTVVDYSLPSGVPRLWVIDRTSGDVLYHTRVAHGSGSGETLAVSFSNVPGSRQTSLGLFRTAEVYVGEHGRSLKLDGLEPGFNDRARERTIVVHAADYVTDDFVSAHGRCGRSWGCPALAPTEAPEIIDAIRGGSFFYAWYPDSAYVEGSHLLNCSATADRESGVRSPESGGRAGVVSR